MATLEQLAAEINARLRQCDQYDDKSKQMKISAGQILLQAKELCKEQGIPWREWLEQNVNWGYAHSQRLIGFATSDDPSKAVDEYRDTYRRHQDERRKFARTSEGKIAKVVNGFASLEEEEREVAFPKIQMIYGS